MFTAVARSSGYLRRDRPKDRCEQWEGREEHQRRAVQAYGDAGGDGAGREGPRKGDGRDRAPGPCCVGMLDACPRSARCSACRDPDSRRAPPCESQLPDGAPSASHATSSPNAALVQMEAGKGKVGEPEPAQHNRMTRRPELAAGSKGNAWHRANARCACPQAPTRTCLDSQSAGCACCPCGRSSRAQTALKGGRRNKNSRTDGTAAASCGMVAFVGSAQHRRWCTRSNTLPTFNAVRGLHS